jgi:DNA-binding NarL/FixJ family response regulator
VIRVLLAEDQGMMRGALAMLLDLEDDIQVVARVETGDRVLAAALDARPDVALLDIEMPGRSGLDVAADLRSQLPGCKVLMLTTFGRPGYLRRAMEAGASGFLIKDCPVEELADAIRKVHAGQPVMDPARRNGWLLAPSRVSDPASRAAPARRSVVIGVPTVREVTGQAPRTFAQWAAAHADAFR